MASFKEHRNFYLKKIDEGWSEKVRVNPEEIKDKILKLLEEKNEKKSCRRIYLKDIAGFSPERNMVTLQVLADLKIPWRYDRRRHLSYFL